VIQHKLVFNPGRRVGTFALIAACTIGASITLTACGGGDSSSTSKALATLDGAKPLIIAHRGLPGLYPEETLPAYEGAVDAGADSLEEDLHLTKDCVLVARHNPWLSDNTNIADIALTNPTVAARKRTVPGVLVNINFNPATPPLAGGTSKYLSDLTNPADPSSVLKSLVVDGEDHTNDWSITDFTAAELKQWIGGTTYDAAALRVEANKLNGQYPVLTMQEIIDLAKSKSALTGRTITVYPETKNPVWNNAQAIANGCDTAKTGHPFEDAVIKLVNDNSMNSKTAPIFLQSFDPASLKYMRSKGLNTRMVQLIDAWDVNYSSGAMVYETKDSGTIIDGRPYSWTLAGDGRYFDAMLTPAGLADIKTYADGIGPWKPQVMKLTGSDGTFAGVNSAVPTSLLADAHKAGLFVHVYTFRNEAKYLAGVFKGDPAAELLTYLRAGVDAVFTDFSNTAVPTRDQYLKEMGR
jgi:glycerophosphoryl diester phosphodiesterase